MKNLKIEIRKLIDNLRPKFEGNLDPLIWDYNFYTELEKLAKKERQATLDMIMRDREIKEGRVARGKQWALDLKIVLMNVFDKELFIENLIKRFGVEKLPRHELREIATTSVVQQERKTFKAVDREEE
jgi:hypothetical protein